MNLPLPILFPSSKKLQQYFCGSGSKGENRNGDKRYKRTQKSMMKRLSPTDGFLTRSRKHSLKETEIGLVPEDWEIVRVGDVFEFSRKPNKLK